MTEVEENPISEAVGDAPEADIDRCRGLLLIKLHAIAVDLNYRCADELVR